MKNFISHRSWGAMTGSVLVLCGSLAHAQAVPGRKTTPQRVEALEQLVIEQGVQIDSMRQQLREQADRQRELERSLAETERSAQSSLEVRVTD